MFISREKDWIMKLQQLQIFQNLTEEELEKSLVCSQAVVKKYPKDTYIFSQGDVPLKLYFILENYRVGCFMVGQ